MRRSARVEKVRKGTISERDRDHPAIVQPAFQRSLFRCRTQEIRQAGRVGFAVQYQGPVLGFVGQHVLAEGGGEFGQLFGDGGVLLLEASAESFAPARTKSRWMRSSNRRCSASRPGVALFKQRIDTFEQAHVHVNGIAVRGQRARPCRAPPPAVRARSAKRGGDIGEHHFDARDQPARTVKGGNGVIERGRGSLRGDGVDFLAVCLECHRQCRAEMCRAEFTEWRQAEGCVPFAQQGLASSSAGRGRSWRHPENEWARFYTRPLQSMRP